VVTQKPDNFELEEEGGQRLRMMWMK